MDARVISAFTRAHSPYLKGIYARLRGLWTGVNALNGAVLPAHDGSRVSVLKMRRRKSSPFAATLRQQRGPSRHVQQTAMPVTGFLDSQTPDG
jgi:hypothetical protein